MAQQVYRSTDPGAPILRAHDPALTPKYGLSEVLDKVLVSGYGSKAGAGWSIAFTDISKRVYRQGGGPNFYLRLLETQGAGGSNRCRLRGYRTMSDIDTGTGDFPSWVAISDPNSFTYAYTDTAGPVPWIVFADDQTFYMFSEGSPASWYPFGYGSFQSYRPSDPNAVFVAGSQRFSFPGNMFGIIANSGGNIEGWYLAGDHLGVAGSIACGVHGNYAVGVYGPQDSTSSGYKGKLPWPNPADGRIRMSPVYIHESANGVALRGRLRGVWQLLHVAGSLINFDQFLGTGALAGKSFMVITPVNVNLSGSNSGGYMVIETSPWA